jgi:hypothetical protein
MILNAYYMYTSLINTVPLSLEVQEARQVCFLVFGCWMSMLADQGNKTYPNWSKNVTKPLEIVFYHLTLVSDLYKKSNKLRN